MLLAQSTETELKKLDEAILEELARRGPGSRVELTRRLAGRMQNALNRLSDAGLVHKIRNSPDRRVDEKVYSLTPDQIRSPPFDPKFDRRV